MNIFKYILDLINPKSLINLDRRINKLRKSIVTHHFLTKEVLELETMINKAKDDSVKLNLKHELSNELKIIYDQHIAPDYIDRGW